MDENRKNLLKQQALKKILSIYGTSEGEYVTDLFIEHHLEEIEVAYWETHFGVSKPSGLDILNSLVLSDIWDSEEDGNIDTFDFSLPGDVTDYMISVRFDKKGDIIEVDMES